MTVRVAFVLPSFAGGGAERVMLALAGALDRTRFAPAIVALSGEGPLRAAVPPGIEVESLGRPRLRTAMPALVSALRRRNPELVISTFVHLNLALLAARPFLRQRTKLVLRDANIASASLPHAPFGGAMAFGVRRLYGRADRILCSSGRMMRDFATNYHVPAERMVVLPTPVDEAMLRALAAAPRREPGAGPRFVAAGRLTHQKGFDRLIEWIAALPADAHLTILGAGRDEAALRAAADKAGVAARVCFAGHLAAPWAHMAGADAFLLPSRWEGLPNVVLEALACGTKVIATDEAGAIAEIAEAAPKGAVTVATAGPDFVAAMRAVSRAPEATLRPSLLPAAYRLEAVAAQFAEILACAASPG